MVDKKRIEALTEALVDSKFHIAIIVGKDSIISSCDGDIGVCINHILTDYFFSNGDALRSFVQHLKVSKFISQSIEDNISSEEVRGKVKSMMQNKTQN